MSRNSTYRECSIRRDGSVSVREHAYAVALMRLSGRESLASRLTDDQAIMLEGEQPFEIGAGAA